MRNLILSLLGLFVFAGCSQDNHSEGNTSMTTFVKPDASGSIALQERKSKPIDHIFDNFIVTILGGKV